MSVFPAYSCSCCGVTNGDMFYDYYLSLGREPTETEIAEFKMYRKVWWMVREQESALLVEQRVLLNRLSGVGRRHSAESRAKISATQRAKAQLIKKG